MSVSEWKKHINELLAQIQTIPITSEQDIQSASLRYTDIQNQLKRVKSQITTEKKDIRLQSQDKRLSTGTNPFIAMTGGKGHARHFAAQRHQDQRRKEFYVIQEYDQLLQQISFAISSIDQRKLHLRQKLQQRDFTSLSAPVAPADSLPSFYMYSLGEVVAMAFLLLLFYILIFAVSQSASFLRSVSFLFLLAPAGYAIYRDWDGVKTLRGTIRWNSLQQKNRIWVALALVVFWALLMAFYIGKVAMYYRANQEEAHQQIQQQNAQLEADLGMEPATEGTCAKCGKPLQQNAEFCAFCGSSAKEKLKVCPTCSTVALAGAAFCPTCGNTLS